MPAVTEMTLSLQLKQLEKDGLVSRKVNGKKPPIKVVYSLTDFGKSFIPVLESITQWGNQIVSEKGEFVTADWNGLANLLVAFWYTFSAKIHAMPKNG